MLLQTRRSALLSFAAISAAGPSLLAAGLAQAQTPPAASDAAQADYVVQTLTVGGLSMQTSQVAAAKAQDPMVIEFAQLEANEQQAIANVLAATEAGRTPPALSADQMAMVQMLQDMEPGPEFDRAYIEGQIMGHQQLLEIQQTLSAETIATIEAVTAKLAEQAVTSHLAMLNHITMALDANAAAGAAQPAGGAEAPQPAGGAEAATPAPEAPAAGAAPAAPAPADAAPPAGGATPPAGGATPAPQ